MVYSEPPQTRRRMANAERILDAATGLVLEEGLDALSIKRVADRADYTAGALYRYYANKDALLAAVVVRALGSLTADLVELERSCTDESALMQVIALCLNYRSYAQREPNLFALFSRLVAEPRALIEDDAEVEPVIRGMITALAPVSRALTLAAKDGELRRGQAMGRTLHLFAALQGALMLRKHETRSGGIINAQEISTLGLKTALVGWGASPESVRRAFRRAEATIDARNNNHD